MQVRTLSSVSTVCPHQKYKLSYVRLLSFAFFSEKIICSSFSSKEAWLWKYFDFYSFLQLDKADFLQPFPLLFRQLCKPLIFWNKPFHVLWLLRTVTLFPFLHFFSCEIFLWQAPLPSSSYCFNIAAATRDKLHSYWLACSFRWK